MFGLHDRDKSDENKLIQTQPNQRCLKFLKYLHNGNCLHLLVAMFLTDFSYFVEGHPLIISPILFKF